MIANFVKDLKPAAHVAVELFVADPTPVEVADHPSGEGWVVRPSCDFEGVAGVRAVRLHAFADEFPATKVTQSVCGRSGVWMERLATTIVAMLE